eukprot:sb/3470574/
MSLNRGPTVLILRRKPNTIRDMEHDSGKPIKSVRRYETRFGEVFYRFSLHMTLSPLFVALLSPRAKGERETWRKRGIHNFYRTVNLQEMTESRGGLHMPGKKAAKPISTDLNCLSVSVKSDQYLSFSLRVQRKRETADRATKRGDKVIVMKSDRNLLRIVSHISDPDLVTPDLVTPRFSDMINFPRYMKLMVFDPDLVAPPI